ncbi:Cysteine--tRNA ligase, cytoplasmic [Hondaea fermentalgiana]|uniref:cysteine--tRNA ligase n=1 Tax=Hondaea fermentalgiana TaxID=2315210 RepID=A0A2R5G1Z0_9STRA|nr:Cysteine--tRNA ligase, cytoplasmic [Hondaea fermentalgiana]|eukprot:GBG24555.1 Cysteine--tRNA ligase, cytoplasmic [Hondaea fermentalgiana]
MYVCGPTVYDAAHLGHARTYVQFDAIRRILREVYGWQVAFFMNITDVDDKILERARTSGTPWRDLAQKHESTFFRDMRRLGVQPPTLAPRATESIEPMIAHIEDLVAQDLAYVGTNTGSVYFSTADFDKSVEQHPQFRYGALDPSRAAPTGVDSAAASAAAVAAVESDPDAGPFGSSDLASGVSGEKRSAKDFALWKCIPDAPADESWDSPWGPGRPGWHAECAVMIKHTAGTIRQDGRLDIHGGGIDLRFPHHENERAQSQTCCGPDPWTSHFLHTGHLHIAGRKMSKSLKNFITIGELLDGPVEALPPGFQPLTARQMRLLFLNVRYNAPMELTAEAVQSTLKLDARLEDTFARVRLAAEAQDALAPSRSWAQHDTQLLAEADRFQHAFRAALRSDFDTASGLRLAHEFAASIHAYLSGETAPQPNVAQQALQELRSALSILGIGASDNYALPGYGASGSSRGQDVASGPSSEELTNALVDFRSAIREAAQGKDFPALFAACDQLRDVVLPSLGVRLVDHEKASTWSPCAPVSPSSTEPSSQPSPSPPRDEPEAPVAPQELFRGSPDYSDFDADGVPTHGANGEELSKNARKKLLKRMKIHTDKYERWLARQKS